MEFTKAQQKHLGALKSLSDSLKELDGTVKEFSEKIEEADKSLRVTDRKVSTISLPFQTSVYEHANEAYYNQHNYEHLE